MQARARPWSQARALRRSRQRAWSLDLSFTAGGTGLCTSAVGRWGADSSAPRCAGTSLGRAVCAVGISPDLDHSSRRGLLAPQPPNLPIARVETVASGQQGEDGPPSARGGSFDVVRVGRLDPAHQATKLTPGRLDRVGSALRAQRPELGGAGVLVVDEA